MIFSHTFEVMVFLFFYLMGQNLINEFARKLTQRAMNRKDEKGCLPIAAGLIGFVVLLILYLYLGAYVLIGWLEG